MNRVFTIVASTVVAGLVGSSLPVRAQPDGGGRDERPRRVAKVALGHIEGVVVDERGAPLSGATVSAFGLSNASALTDKRGAFAMRALPPGPYLMRAERQGYLPSRRQFVQVAPTGPTRFAVKLQRTGTPGDSPGILAAVMAPVGTGDPLDLDPVSTGGDGPDPTEDHSETAWRLRHLKRSILKEAERAAIEGDTPADGIQPAAPSFMARAVGSARLLESLPFSGQVNFLASGSFDGPLTGSSTVPLRQVAFVSLGGPAWGHADWSGQVMAQGGDLGSWFLAGAYRKRAPSAHLYDIGVSYSTQRFTPGSRWPIAVGSEGARSAGAIYGTDRWTLSPRAALTYGARYTHYDYLNSPGLLSPRVGIALVPLRGLRLEATASRRMLAPGAEEFLEPLVSGLWVPPERTFLGPTRLEAERTNHFDVSLEKALGSGYAVSVRGFYQLTANQQVAFFGLQSTPAGDTGHYAVGNAGDLEARGWSVGVSNMMSAASHVRGSIAYTVASTRWTPGVASGYGLLLIGAAARPPYERLQDLATTVEADLPLTATRVLAVYRLNTGFAFRDADALKPGLGARFDFQVTQPLPFLDFTSARWQAMVAVRNLFRDPASDSSVYDELLVLHPPKRVVTGLLVRF